MLGIAAQPTAVNSPTFDQQNNSFSPNINHYFLPGRYLTEPAN